MGSARHVWGLVTGQDWAVSRSAGVAGDAHGRWPVECRAVGVERRPVHRLIACAAGPGGVPAAVAEAGLMADEDLAGAELVPVRASRRWVGDPLPGRGLHELAQHDDEANRVDSQREVQLASHRKDASTNGRSHSAPVKRLQSAQAPDG